ncbi:MAG: DNA/RNA nuclease SfsA [Deltaproteobacteria bacterium]|nr:DNA/RNA nuclease SfsA [Deltaproteobacteria bacterium]
MRRVIYQPPLVAAVYCERPNRFTARVRVGGAAVDAHLANPGRMAELLVPGARCYVRHRPDRVGRLQWDACLIRHGRVWVGLQSHLANDLVDEALGRFALPSLSSYRVDRREAPYGEGRFDFALRHRRRSERTMLLEVKSCTLVDGRRGYFPDAPTVRGARHVREAIRFVGSGGEAAVLFCVGRPDADSVSPNRATDPEFGRALDDAADAGVRLIAARCSVSPKAMTLRDEIPVVL